MEHPWHVRFIEVMPIASANGASLVSAAEIRAMLPGLAPDDSVTGYGPARMYKLPGARGTISIISPVTDHFCGACNRLRLTADGKLRPCLLDDGEVDVRAALRSAAPEEALARLLTRAVANKPERHHLSDGLGPRARTMAQIGG